MFSILSFQAIFSDVKSLPLQQRTRMGLWEIWPRWRQLSDALKSRVHVASWPWPHLFFSNYLAAAPLHWPGCIDLSRHHSARPHLSPHPLFAFSSAHSVLAFSLFVQRSFSSMFPSSLLLCAASAPHPTAFFPLICLLFMSKVCLNCSLVSFSAFSLFLLFFHSERAENWFHYFLSCSAVTPSRYSPICPSFSPFFSIGCRTKHFPPSVSSINDI